MNASAPSAAFLAVDWGTTNLRAWTVTAAGQIVGARHYPWGVGALKPGEGVQRLQRDIRPALDAERLPALLCGMAGANIGLAPAPYVPCPAGAADMAAQILVMDRRTRIVPGLRCRRPGGEPDVMRGEETKIMGWLSQQGAGRSGETILCLPGTHCKWVSVRDGRIERFVTAMTGELFSVLSRHSVLGSGAAPSDDEAFDEGLEAGARSGALAARLFAVRARMVGDGWAPEKAASYLSGLLIGDEIASLPDLIGLKPGGHVCLLGDPALRDLYAPALTARGFSVEQADGEAAVIAGLNFFQQMAAQS